MRRSTRISIIVHCPQTDAGMRELEARVAAVHADTAKAYIDNQQCPAAQKVALAESAAAQIKKDIEGYPICGYSTA